MTTTAEIRTGEVVTKGAELVYDYVGEGPVLLLISGGGGDAERYHSLMPLLTDEFTVVSYDRRCNSRSTGDREQDLDMAQQARDALAVVEAMGQSRAYVFGNSGGAEISLQLAIDHPEAIIAMIAHEAPTVSILPDGDKWLSFMKDVHATFLAEGVTAAMTRFLASLVGIDLPGGRPIPADAMPNAEFFMAREYLPIGFYSPELDRIRANRVSMVTAAGVASADAYYARTASVQAARIGCPTVEFPGNHLAFQFEPANFAVVLRDTFHQLSTMDG